MGRTRQPRNFQTRSKPYSPRPRSVCEVCETEHVHNEYQVCNTCQDFFNDTADPHGLYRCFEDESCRVTNPRIDPRHRCPGCWLDKCRRTGMQFTGGAQHRDRRESYSSPEPRSRPGMPSPLYDRERDWGYDEDDWPTSTYGDIDDRARHYRERSPYSDNGEANGSYRNRNLFSDRGERSGGYQSRSFSYTRKSYFDRDHPSDGEEENGGSNWYRGKTSDQRAFGPARKYQRSMPPPLNADRQAAPPLVNDWVTTVLSSLCTLGGKANVKIIFKKIQEEFPDQFRESVRSFQERLEGNRENFSLKKAAGEGYTINAFTKLRLCTDHCTKEGCENQACDSLHICKFFLVSSCSAEKKNTPCKYGHKFESPHNDDLLSRHGLRDMDPAHLKKIFQLNRSKATLPTPCKFYNVIGGCKWEGGKCWAMHICGSFLKGECKFGENCKRSHNILDDQPRTILLQYGFNIKQSSEKVLKDLTEQINRS